MKRLVVVLILSLTISSVFAQKAEVLKSEGDKAYNSKQYALALVKYEKALSVWGNKPADNAMIFSMGTCAYNVSDMKKSQKYIDMTIAAGYNLDMAYQYKACIMQAVNNQEGYVMTLKEGLVKVPNSKAMKETLAKHYFEEGDKHYHEARDILQKAADLVNSGKLLANDKAYKDANAKARTEFNEAVKFMDMSLKVNPDYENAKIIRKNCQNQIKMLI